MVLTHSHLQSIMNSNSILIRDRRKFRSQTSDNMERWKSQDVKSSDGEKVREKIRDEKVRREKIRDEKDRREKMQMRKQVEMSQTQCFSNVLWLRRVEK